MHSIFPVLSLDRNVVKWEDYLDQMTPVENHAGLWLKREDYFCPLSYGGVNGSKLRQIIWLIEKGVREGATHLYSGASVKSPQLSMSATVARHFGIDTTLILGATKPETASRHPNVQVAARMGADFEIIKVGYNPALQRATLDRTGKDPKGMIVRYGITLDIHESPAQDIVDFHELGANQVRNLPDVEELILPAGSCNTLTSVLFGIAKYRTSIKRIHTLGIGPSKLQWVHDRLKIIEKQTQVDIIPVFNRIWPQYGELSQVYKTRYPHQVDWKHWSLHDAKFSAYQDEMKEKWGNVVLHPTYEGKMMRWLKQSNMIKQDGSQCFWIVGSAPNISVMEPYYTKPHQEIIHVAG